MAVKIPSNYRKDLQNHEYRNISHFKLLERIYGYIFISPAFFLYLVFLAGPLVGALVLSLFKWDILTPATYVGLSNYKKLFSDSMLLEVTKNTLVFAFWSVVLHAGVGLLIALLVNRKIHAGIKYFVRTAYFFPLLISWAAVAIIWRYILDPDFGFFNYYLRTFGLDPPVWLLDPKWTLPAIIGVDLWHTFGFLFIVILAGLQNIPTRLYEAAMLDGAGAWRRFIDITLPLLTPTLFFVIIITFIGAFQVFEPMYIISAGGPLNTTRSLVMYVYETAFRRFSMGYASAMANIIFLVVMVVTLIQLRLSRYWVHYE